MIDKLNEKLGGQVKQNEILANHVTFKIGGPAKYFFEAKTKTDLVLALKAAGELGLNYFILGGGSNLLVSDNGFDGLVIKQLSKEFKIDGEKVYAESGVPVVDLLAATLDAGLIGWSWAAGLPGTIGGAVRGNAGAYGEGMSDIVESVGVLKDGQIINLTNQEMKFSYRHSIVKDSNWVVLSAVLKLKKGDTQKDVERVATYNQRRRDTQPLDLPNSGCIFKNIDLTQVQIDEVKVKKALDVSDEEFKEATKFKKLPVSYIFDKLNLKGKKIGGAQVSERHGAFIVNVGDAKAEHVVMLISDLKMHVRNELGIQLQEEVQYVGF